MRARIWYSRLGFLLFASMLAGFVCLAGLGAVGCAGSAGSSELTLQSVVLYQNGIGYFEHRGTAPGSSIELSFRRHEIGDVLKTITIVPIGAAAATAGAVAALTMQAPDMAPGAEAGDAADRVALRVALTGAAEQLSIAYAVPTAAWKPTYRVVLPEHGEGQALVQGWAMVDNTSDSDWRAVSLTLATGAPLSFAIDLMTPRFVARPDLTGTLVEPVVLGAIRSARTGPGDGDGDGLRDADDLCPDDAEDMDGFEDQDGCPDADNDSDRIVDVDDLCPSEPETYNGMEDEDGCPDRGRVVVTESNIEILDKVYFKHESADIQAQSVPIVDAIAATLVGNPDIQVLAVQGHTASNEKNGWDISRRRASAIERALVAQGVRTKLVVEPYGATQPIRTGKDEQANAVNRRVEFLILKRTDEDADEGKGKDAPTDRPDAPAFTRAAAQRSVKAQVEAHELAGSVRYRIDAKVTIPRGASALVPIINHEVAGEDVFLFRPEANAPASDRHPWRAARVDNQTGLEWQPGPVAVFARGAFVGEGLIERLHAGDIAFIPYALDSSCTVSVRGGGSEEPVRIVTVARGVVEVENREIKTTRYEVRPGAKAPARIILQHARASGYEGVDLPPRTQDDGFTYMVPLPIQAGKLSVLEVVEKKPRRRTIYIENADAGELAVYLSGGDLPEATSNALRRVIALRERLSALDEDTDSLRASMLDVGERADEIRASLQTIGALGAGKNKLSAETQALRRQLLASLSEATARTEACARDLATRSAELAEARVRFAEAVRELSYAPGP